MLSLKSLSIILLLIALLVTTGFLLRTLKKLRNKQFSAGLSNGLYSLLALFLVITSGLMVSNVLVYHRLSHETPIAQLHIKPLDRQLYQVSVVYLPDCQLSQFTLKGDEWQIDARIIKWHSWANLLGLDALYQLDRIQGRYRSIKQQRQNLPTVFKLEQQPQPDLWALKKQYQWLPLLDAQYGQSVFMTMAPDQWYEVHLSQSGLIARKINRQQVNNHCAVAPVIK